MTRNTTIKNTVLNRVNTIHVLRAMTGRVTVSFFSFALSLYFIGREVWVARVWENLPHVTNIIAISQFIEGAFLNTTVVVQLLSVLALIALGWLIREGTQIFTVSRYRYT